MTAKITDFIQTGVSIPLTKIAAGYSPSGLIADKILRSITHPVSAGKVPVFGKEAFKARNTLRAPGAHSNRAPFDPGSWVSFNCMEHDIAIPLDQQELNEALRLPNVDTSLFNMQNRARNVAQFALAVGKESTVATLLQTTGTYATGNNVNLATGDKEFDATNGDPITAIETGREAIRSKIGRYPNTLILGAETYETLKFHADYIDKMKLTADKIVRPDIIGMMHDIDNVMIGLSMGMNADGTLADLWTDSAILLYIPKAETPGLDEPSFGYTIRPQTGDNPYPYVDLFEEEGGKIINVRCTDKYDHVVLMNDAGYLMYNCKE